MPSAPLDLLTRVDALAFLLTEAGVPTSTDAAELNLPGALIDVKAASFDTLDGYTLKVSILLVVPDTGPRRSLAALTTLYNLAAQVVSPDGGDVMVRTTTLAETPGPLPCLEIPCTL